MALITNGTTEVKAVTPDGEAVSLKVTGTRYVTKVPLKANQELITDGFDHTGYDGVLYVIKTDVASAINGIKIDFSDDGTIWEASGIGITYNDLNVQSQRVLAPKGKYIRFHYKNNGTDQSYFRFEIRFLIGTVQFSGSSLNQPLTKTLLAQIVKSVVELPDDSGVYQQIGRVNDAMKVTVVNQETSNEPTETIVNNLPTDYATNNAILNAIAQLTTIIGNQTSGAQRVVQVDGNNQNRGTDANPSKVQFPSGYVANVSVTNLPTTQNVNVTNQPSLQAVSITGVPNVAITNPTDVSTLAKQDTLLALLSKVIANPATEATLNSILTKLNASLNVSVSNFPTNTEISNDTGNPIPINGSVSVSNLPITQAVTGNFYQATQPVSGSVNATIQGTPTVNIGTIPSVEISNDSGSPLPVNGTVNVGNLPATQPVSGNISVSNFPTSQAVTGTFYQAIQPVSGTFWQATQPISASALPLPTGASTSANQATEIASLSSIDGKVSTTAKQDISNAALGTPADAFVADPTANGTIIALLKGVLYELPGQSTATTTSTVNLTANVSTTVMPVNTLRKGGTIFSSNGTILVLLGSGASATLYTSRLVTNSYYEIPYFYTGIVTVFATAASSINVTILT